ncbi:hypothetical protein [Thauera sp.]|uniref:hypothetical protein n=1 Tax=Thauera sp. TaxID=1905334 RepID=UPI002CDD604C|nr:hypothetical protein [Thauera sp.]HRP25354.1 hypothetical protein [Thauera sp.]
MNVLDGPAEPRTIEAARRREPLTAANARAILAEMESQVRSASKRRSMARFFAENATNATAEARAVYRAYADSV